MKRIFGERTKILPYNLLNTTGVLVDISIIPSVIGWTELTGPQPEKKILTIYCMYFFSSVLCTVMPHSPQGLHDHVNNTIQPETPHKRKC